MVKSSKRPRILDVKITHSLIDYMHASTLLTCAHGLKKPLENRQIFVRIRETDPDWFHRFSKNQMVKFENLNI
jgi:hypothetical protein